MTDTVRKQINFSSDFCGKSTCDYCFANVVINEGEVEVEAFNSPRLTFDESYYDCDESDRYDDRDYESDYYDDRDYDEAYDYEPLTTEEPADTNDYDYQQAQAEDFDSFASLLTQDSRISSETVTRYERDTDLIDNVILNTNSNVRDLRRL